MIDKKTIISNFISKYDIYDFSPKQQYIFGLFISKLENFNIEQIKGAISLFQKEIMPLFTLTDDENKFLEEFDKKYLELQKQNKKELIKFLSDEGEYEKIEHL